MVSEEDSKALIQASSYFHEMFKKTILAAPTPLPSATRTQMDLLMTLYTEGPLNMSALSERVGIAPEQATRAMRALREQELVETARGEENRRMVIAHLTERGMLMMDDHTRAINENLMTVLEGLDPDDMEQLARMARGIVALMRKTGLKHAVPDPEARAQRAAEASGAQA